MPFNDVFEKHLERCKPGQWFAVPDLSAAIARAKSLVVPRAVLKGIILAKGLKPNAARRAFHDETQRSNFLKLEVREDGFVLQMKTEFGELTLEFAAKHGCAPYTGQIRRDKLAVILPHVNEMTFSTEGTIFFRGETSKAFLQVARMDETHSG